jgi:hypothetical protein
MTLIQENPPQKPPAVSPDQHNPGPTKRVQYYTSVSLTRSLATFLCQSQFSALAWFRFQSKFESFIVLSIPAWTSADLPPLLTSPCSVWGMYAEPSATHMSHGLMDPA